MSIFTAIFSKVAALAVSALVAIGIISAPINEQIIKEPSLAHSTKIEELIQEIPTKKEEQNSEFQSQLAEILNSVISLQKQAKAKAKAEEVKMAPPLVQVEVPNLAPIFGSATPSVELPAPVIIEEIPAPIKLIEVIPVPIPIITLEYTTTTIPRTERPLVAKFKFNNIDQRISTSWNSIFFKLLVTDGEDTENFTVSFNSIGGKTHRIAVEGMNYHIGNNVIISVYAPNIPQSVKKFKIVFEEFKFQGTDSKITITPNLETPEITVLD